MMSDVKKLFFELTLLVLVLVIGCTVLFSLPGNKCNNYKLEYNNTFNTRKFQV